MILGLILAPSFLVPIIGIATIELLSWNNAQIFAKIYVPLSMLAPLIWIPAVIGMIRYLFNGRTGKGDLSAISLTLIFTIVPSVCIYYFLIFFAALMVSGL